MRVKKVTESVTKPKAIAFPVAKRYKNGKGGLKNLVVIFIDPTTGFAVNSSDGELYVTGEMDKWSRVTDENLWEDWHGEVTLEF